MANWLQILCFERRMDAISNEYQITIKVMKYSSEAININSRSAEETEIYFWIHAILLRKMNEIHDAVVLQAFLFI